MKKSLKRRYQSLLLIFFAIMVLEAVLVFLSLMRPVSAHQLRVDIQSLVIFFTFVQFIYFIVLFYYIPYKYDVAYKEVHQVINEIAEGKYLIDMDLKSYHQDAEIQSLIKSLQKMMDIIIRFDNLKSDKVYEQHQRLQQLINMLPFGCLVMSAIGEIVYSNNYIKDNIPALAENLNVLETLLPEWLEKELKPLLADGIKYGDNLHDHSIYLTGIGAECIINSSVVRNRKGHVVGAIYLIDSPGVTLRST